MDDDDYACNKFAPQRFRPDTCRKCFQPLKMHKESGTAAVAGSRVETKPAPSPPPPRPSPPTMGRDSRSPSVEGRPRLLRSGSYVKSAGDSLKRREDRASGSSPPTPTRPPPPMQQPPPLPPPPQMSPEPAGDTSVPNRKSSESGLPRATESNPPTNGSAPARAPPEAHSPSQPQQITHVAPQPANKVEQTAIPASTESSEPQKEPSANAIGAQRDVVQSVKPQIVDEDIVVAVDEGVTESAPHSMAPGDLSEVPTSPLQSGEEEHKPVEPTSPVSSQGGRPSEDSPLHAHTVLQGNDAIPQGNEAISPGVGTISQGDEVVPKADEAVPRGAPAVDEVAPQSDEAMPQGDEAATEGDETVRQGNGVAPRGDEAVPRGEVPGVDTAAPEVDTAAPGIDTAAPEVDTAAPGSDTATPGVDTAAPEVDTAAPVVDTAAPEVNTAAPGVDTAAPDVDTAAPGIDTAAPGVDTAAPGVDTAAPGSDTAAPGVDTAAPGVDTAAPGVHTAAPGVDTAVPEVDNAAPGVDTAAPEVDNAAPGVDTAAPEDSKVAEGDIAALGGDEPVFRGEDARPQGDEAAPLCKEAIPEGDKAADGDKVVPEGEETITMGDEAAPEGDKGVLESEETVLQGDEAVPRSNEVALDGDEIAPQDEELAPRSEEPVQQDEVAVPQGDEAKLQGDEMVPQGNDVVPEGDEAPSKGDETWFEDGKATRGDEEPKVDATPQGEDAIPQGDNAMPEANDTVPQGEDAIPWGDEEVPRGDEAPEGAEAVQEGDEAMPEGNQGEPQGHCVEAPTPGLHDSVPPPPPLPPHGFPADHKDVPFQPQPHTPPSSPTEDRPRPGSPRPPPLDDRSALLAEIRLGRALQHVNPPLPTPPVQVFVHDIAMAAIRSGVQLNVALRPLERTEREEKVVDVSSELRKMQNKRRKQEAEEQAERVEEYSAAFRELGDNIRQMFNRGMPHLQQLRQVVAEARALLQRAEIPEEILTRRMRWPTEILYPFALMVDEVATFEQKVDQMNQLLQSYQEAKASGNFHVNSELIEQYANGVIKMGTYFQRLVQNRELHQQDVQLVMARASDVMTPLMDMLYEKAFAAHQTAVDPTMRRYEGRFKAKFAMDLLRLCCTLTEKLSTYAHIPRHDRYTEAQAKCEELELQKTGSVTGEGGNSLSVDVTDSVSPSTAAQGEESGHAITQDLRMALQSGSAEAVIHNLENITPDGFFMLERSLLIAVVETQNLGVLDAVLQVRKRMAAQIKDQEERKHDFDWLCEAASKGYHNILEHLARQWGMDVNSTSPEAGNTPLHLAARKPDMALMASLIRLGADPLALNSTKRTPLQLLAIKHYPAHSKSTSLEPREPLFDLSVYINNPSMSDVILISEDGKRFHAHRLVLCAQSAVFKAMMASQEWGTSKRNEVKLTGLESKVVRALLHYLYTGKCCLTLEDLNLGVELMAAADQFLLESMRHQCEAFLSDQVDHEVVIPLYYAATHHSAPMLLNAACHHLLVHYNKVDDTGHKALLDLLDSSEFSRPSKGSKSVSYMQ